MTEFRLLQPPARMMATVSCPLVSKSCAAPTRRECPEISSSRGRSPLSEIIDFLMMLLTLRPQSGLSMQRSLEIAQKSQSISSGLTFIQSPKSIALRLEPKTRRPRPNWFVLLRRIIPRSVPSCCLSMSPTRSAVSSERRARKSYPRDRTALFLIPIKVRGCASMARVRRPKSDTRNRQGLHEE